MRSCSTALLDVLGLAVGERSFVALEFLGQFFSYNCQLGRCFNAHAHAAVADLYDRDRDLVTDQNPFANFSTEN